MRRQAAAAAKASPMSSTSVPPSMSPSCVVNIDATASAQRLVTATRPGQTIPCPLGYFAPPGTSSESAPALVSLESASTDLFPLATSFESAQPLLQGRTVAPAPYYSTSAGHIVVPVRDATDVLDAVLVLADLALALDAVAELRLLALFEVRFLTYQTLP